MIVVGLGFASNAGVDDLRQAISATLRSWAVATSDLQLIATIDTKLDSVALQTLGQTLAVRVQFIDVASLQSVSDIILTHSPRSMAATGIGSISEACALRAAGDGGRLLAARSIHGPVTCALAITKVD